MLFFDYFLSSLADDSDWKIMISFNPYQGTCFVLVSFFIIQVPDYTGSKFPILISSIWHVLVIERA